MAQKYVTSVRTLSPRLTAEAPDDARGVYGLIDRREQLCYISAVTHQFKPRLYPKVDDDATVLVSYADAECIIQASWNWPVRRKGHGNLCRAPLADTYPIKPYLGMKAWPSSPH